MTASLWVESVGLPSQMASNEKSVKMPWYHHEATSINLSNPSLDKYSRAQ